MKRIIVLTAVGILSMVLVGPSKAQGPGRGFSVLLCVAEEAGPGSGNAQVGFEILSDTEIDGDLRQAEVEIHHGNSFSQHTIEYEDDGNQQLNCRDTILSVT